MKSKLFYEGRLMGEFDSPVEASVNYLCWHCGKLFAKRICERPFSWYVEEGACAKCGFERKVYSPSICAFERGGEFMDQVIRLPILAAQFLYEADIAIGFQKYEQPTTLTIADLPPYRGFVSPEHSWPQDPLNGGFGNR